MDSFKMIDWVATQPSHIKVGVTIIILVTSALLLAIIWRSPLQAPSDSGRATLQPGAASQVSSTELGRAEVAAGDDAVHCDSLQSATARIRALKGRFAERDLFYTRALGRNVRWSGWVHTVTSSNADVVSVRVRTAKGDLLPDAAISYDARSFRVQAYSLQPEDRVEFAGVIESADGPTIIVKGSSLRLLN